MEFPTSNSERSLTELDQERALRELGGPEALTAAIYNDEASMRLKNAAEAFINRQNQSSQGNLTDQDDLQVSVVPALPSSSSARTATELTRPTVNLNSSQNSATFHLQLTEPSPVLGLRNPSLHHGRGRSSIFSLSDIIPGDVKGSVSPVQGSPQLAGPDSLGRQSLRVKNGTTISPMATLRRQSSTALSLASDRVLGSMNSGIFSSSTDLQRSMTKSKELGLDASFRKGLLLQNKDLEGLIKKENSIAVPDRTRPRFCVGRSLFILSDQNPVRLHLLTFIEHKSVKIFLLLLIAINWLLYATMVYDHNAGTSYFGQFIQDYIGLSIFVCYLVEMVIKILVCGFVMEDVKDAEGSAPNSVRGFFKTAGNRFDFCVVSSFWLNVILQSIGIGDILFLKVIGSLRPLRLLSVTTGLSIISQSITKSARLLTNVAIFLLFFYTMFGILGVQFFRGSMNRLCANVTMTNGTANLELIMPPQGCGGWIDKNNQIQPPVHTGINIKGYLCPKGLQCRVVSTSEIRPTGFLSYDSIFQSVFNIFVSSTEQGWTDIMYRTMDAENSAAVVYHIMAVVLVNLILMNMFVAVIAGTFANIRQQYNDKYEDAKRRKLEDALLADIEPPKNKLKWGPPAIKIEKSKWFRLCVFGLAAASLSTITWAKQPEAADYLIVLWVIDAFLSLFFAFEFAVHYYASGSFTALFKSRARQIDAVTVVVTCIIVLPGVYRVWPSLTVQTDVYRYFCIFQILRFYKTAAMFPRIPEIIKTAFGNKTDLLNTFLFFGVSMAIIATVGMQMFGGKFGFLPGDEQQTNFDNFPMAYLSIFIIMVSDNWTNTLYSGLYSQKDFMLSFITAAIFFIIVFALTHYILIDIAVAVILENFEYDENAKRAGQVERIVEKFQKKQSKIESSYFSLWNPYLYFKPSPEMANLSGIPERLRMPVRKSYLNQLMSAETEETAELVSRSDDIETSPQEESHQSAQSSPMIRESFWRRFFYKTKSAGSAKKSTEEPTPSTESLAAVRERKFNDQLDEMVKSPNRNTQKKKVKNRASLLQNDSQTTALIERKLALIEDFNEMHPTFDSSFFIFSPKNRLRKFCQEITYKSKKPAYQIYRWIMVLSVIASTVTLAIETPLKRRVALMQAIDGYKIAKNATINDFILENPPADLRSILVNSEFFSTSYYIGESILTFIFGIEFLMLTIANGFILSPNAYIKSGWNILDFFVLISMVFGLITESTALNGFPRFIRLIRALRPLKLITFFDGLLEIFTLIVASGPQVLDSFYLALVFMVPWAVYGVNLFAGLFNACNDPSIRVRSECFGTFRDSESGLLQQRIWSYGTFGFDDFPTAIYALFEMIMQEGWSQKMYTGVSVSEPNTTPQWPPAKWTNVFYFLIWMLFGYVLLKNLFVGVVLRAFMTRNETALLTIDQRRWLEAQRTLKLVKPSKRADRPSSVLRRFCFDTIHNKHFTRFMTAIVTLNLLVMASDFQRYSTFPDGTLGYDDTASWLNITRQYLYFVFAFIYCFEFILKITGLGYDKWKRNPWNIFDLITLCGLLPVLFILIFDDSNYTLFQLQKFFLDLIIFKLIQRVRILKLLLKTIVTSFRPIVNISGVLLLIFCVYALICMEIFGLTVYGSTANYHANFRDFPTSLLTLYRMTTGEQWNSIAKDLMVRPPNCVNNELTYLLNDCGSSTWSFLVFITFETLVSLVLMNLFVATVIENFDFSAQDDASFALITIDDVAGFKKKWTEVDPKGSGYISREQLSTLFSRLTGRFSMRIYPAEYSIAELTKCCDIQGSRIDVSKLNSKLENLNLAEVRKRSHSLNFAYQEATTFMVREKGIPFDKVLRTLSFRLIDSHRFLRIEQMLIRQQEEARIMERVRMEKLKAFCHMIIDRRRFLRQTKRQLPKPSIPEIPHISVDSIEQEEAPPIRPISSITTESEVSLRRRGSNIHSIAGSDQFDINMTVTERMKRSKWLRDVLKDD